MEITISDSREHEQDQGRSAVSALAAKVAGMFDAEVIDMLRRQFALHWLPVLEAEFFGNKWLSRACSQKCQVFVLVYT